LVLNGGFFTSLNTAQKVRLNRLYTEVVMKATEGKAQASTHPHILNKANDNI